MRHRHPRPSHQDSGAAHLVCLWRAFGPLKQKSFMVVQCIHNCVAQTVVRCITGRICRSQPVITLTQNQRMQATRNAQRQGVPRRPDIAAVGCKALRQRRVVGSVIGQHAQQSGHKRTAQGGTGCGLLAKSCGQAHRNRSISFCRALRSSATCGFSSLLGSGFALGCFCGPLVPVEGRAGAVRRLTAFMNFALSPSAR